MAVVRTDPWRLVHVSRPVRFAYNLNDLHTVDHVIVDRHPQHPIYIQDPVSFNAVARNAYHMTVNIRDGVSLLYEVHFQPPHFATVASEHHVGYWDEKVRHMTLEMILALDVE